MRISDLEEGPLDFLRKVGSAAKKGASAFQQARSDRPGPEAQATLRRITALKNNLKNDWEGFRVTLQDPNDSAILKMFLARTLDISPAAIKDVSADNLDDAFQKAAIAYLHKQAGFDFSPPEDEVKSPAKAASKASGSFAQPMQAAATAKAAPKAKPRMSIRAATGPVYTAGQKKNVGGVVYTWDGQAWRNPAGELATGPIARAIDQQSSQTS